MGRGKGRGPQAGTSGVQGHVYAVTPQAESADQPVIQGTFLPQAVFESRCQGQLAGWLASLTLEDEERPDLDLPRLVCEYVDFFKMSYLDYLHRG